MTAERISTFVPAKTDSESWRCEMGISRDELDGSSQHEVKVQRPLVDESADFTVRPVHRVHDVIDRSRGLGYGRSTDE